MDYIIWSKRLQQQLFIKNFLYDILFRMNQMVKIMGFVVFAIAAFTFGKNKENPFPKPALQLGQYSYLCSTGQEMAITPIHNLSEIKVLLGQTEFSAVKKDEDGLYQGGAYSLLVKEKDIQVSTDGASFNCAIL